MVVAALSPSGFDSSDGLAYDLKRKVAELITVVNALDAGDDLEEQAAIASLGATTNLTAITAHTATTAIAAEFADLPAARTSVDALRTDAEVAFGQLDTGLTTLRANAEARLDAIEAKVDAILVALRAAGVIAAS